MEQILLLLKRTKKLCKLTQVAKTLWKDHPHWTISAFGLISFTIIIANWPEVYIEKLFINVIDAKRFTFYKDYLLQWKFFT